MELPILDKIMINKIRVTLLFQNPFTDEISFDRFSKSPTVGFRTNACTNPANHPEASNGFKAVMGAATKAVKMVSG